jgi:ornithine cyclodeaminase/alanine dehydrogenase
MTRFLGPDELLGKVSPSLALESMAHAFGLQAADRTTLVPRSDVSSGHGFLRVMPAVLDAVMGVKIMTLADGVGTRYLTLLYDAKSGELLALFDADELTRQRTAATTALAATVMVTESPRRVGLLGSGFEAVGEIRALAALWTLDEVLVYSPHATRRQRFATKMSDELGINIRAVPSARDALRDQGVVVLATKASEPVVNGNELASGCVVLSIGSTRLDLRELDKATFARARTVVADDPEQLAAESGDVAEALSSGVLSHQDIVPLAGVCAGDVKLCSSEDRDLLVFKSVGTAIQDLAIARVIFDDAVKHDYGADLGELARLKPFAQNT